jgi:hypothetical protein
MAENEAQGSARTTVPAPAESDRDAGLRARVEALRVLGSAWGVIAPSFEDAQSLADLGRVLGEELTRLQTAAPENVEAALTHLDTGLKELEGRIRERVCGTPVAQLRSTLEERVSVDRQGVLDLLDLILGAVMRGEGDTRARIPLLDYLTTLLCASDDPETPFRDPVTLTPRLHALCTSANVDSEPRLAELEAELYSAAEGVTGESQKLDRRMFRRRKTELGRSFFAPRLLRAITTFNTAMRRMQYEGRFEEAGRRPRGERPASRVAKPEEALSVFRTQVLPKLAEALRRRTAGDSPGRGPIDRIAWSLDLTELAGPERDALVSPSTGGREGLLGTVVLMGLLARAVIMPENELAAIGIDPDRLLGPWMQELDDALQKAANVHLSRSDVDRARVYSYFRRRFLESAAGQREGPTAPASESPVRDPAAARRQAKRIANEALRTMSDGKRPRRRRERSWTRIARASAAVALVASGLAWVNFVYLDPSRVDPEDLERVSRFLSSGRRSEEGNGSAFVGFLAKEWFTLDAEAQAAEAGSLVSALRDGGVRDVMIYDNARRLRIQALGYHPPRMMPPAPDG